VDARREEKQKILGHLLPNFVPYKTMVPVLLILPHRQKRRNSKNDSETCRLTLQQINIAVNGDCLI
jgi:hypothetical protein